MKHNRNAPHSNSYYSSRNEEPACNSTNMHYLNSHEYETTDYSFESGQNEAWVGPSVSGRQACFYQTASYHIEGVQEEIGEYLDTIEETEAVREIMAPTLLELTKMQPERIEKLPDEEVLRCSTCQAPFRDRAALERHHRRVHQTSQQVSLMNRCEICPAILKDSQGKNIHIQRIHVGRQRHDCPHCHAYFNSHPRLQAHILAEHSKTPRVSRSAHRANERNLYKCDLCDYCSNRKDNLARHLKTKHKVQYRGEGTHACSTCGKRFKRRCHLNAHKKKQHE